MVQVQPRGASPMPASNDSGDRAVADNTTIAVFQSEWDTYRKMVENNCLFHREA